MVRSRSCRRQTGRRRRSELISVGSGTDAAEYRNPQRTTELGRGLRESGCRPGPLDRRGREDDVRAQSADWSNTESEQGRPGDEDDETGSGLEQSEEQET